MKLVAKITRKYYKRDIVEYPEGVVIFESSTPGSYDVDLVSGQYEIICVGAGGGGAAACNSWCCSAGGGSGGYSNVLQNVSEGTYTAVVGAGGAGTGQVAYGTAGSGGDSSFDTVVGYGGAGGFAHGYNGAWTGGAGGTGTTTNGNTGTSGNNYSTRNYTPGGGAASVYNGYGVGGGAYTCYYKSGFSSTKRKEGGTQPGGSGYVKVTCYAEITITPGTAEDYDFYEDIPEMNAVVNNNKLYAFNR